MSDAVAAPTYQLNGTGRVYVKRHSCGFRELALEGGLCMVEVKALFTVEHRVEPASLSPNPMIGSDGETTMFCSRPVVPIGSLIWYAPCKSSYGDRDPLIAVHLRLAPELFRDLWEICIAGKPMPGRLELKLTQVKVKEGASNGCLELTQDTHFIKSAQWSMSRLEAENLHWLVERSLLVLIDQLIERVDWKYDGWKLGNWQFRLVASELLASTIKRMHAGLSCTADVDDELKSAFSIATRLYDGLADAERATRKDRQQLNSKIKPDTKLQSIEWYKRMSHLVFQLGLDSSDWSSIHRDMIENPVIQYLASDLHSPAFEWIVVDALVYAEVRASGETIKQKLPWSPHDPLGLNAAYFSSAGNMERMFWKRFRGNFVWALVKLGLWVGLPAWWAWYEIERGEMSKVMLATVAWLTLTLLWPRIKKGIGFGHDEFSDRFQAQIKLLNKMGAAYSEVTSDKPPRAVLRTLERTHDEGAVWDGAIWSILIRAERRDPVSWRDPKDCGGSTSLANHIALKLQGAYTERKKAGKTIPEPDLNRGRWDVIGSID